MSDWKESAKNRRDFKASKDEMESNHANTKRKDTKKWCKGKAGKEHKLEVKSYSELKGEVAKSAGGKAHHNGWYILYCSVCGKDIETYYSFAEKPEWLVNYLSSKKA